MISLSKHFIENWKKRVSNGIAPDVNAIQSLIAGSVRIQKGRQFILQGGERYKTLSMYWHPEFKIVVSLDPMTGCAVSVATDTMRGENDKKRAQAVKQAKRDGYVPMTMHGMGGAV